MRQFRTIRRGIIGALFLLGAATPFALTSCEGEHAKVDITLQSDFSALVAAMKDNNISLVDKLGKIETAVSGGFVNDVKALGLIKEAVNSLEGTAQEKLEAIKIAITSQTTSFDTKLGVIEAAISGGFADDKAALGLIEEAIKTLKGTNEQKLAAIEEAIKNQPTGIETKLGLIQTALDTGLADQKTAIGELKTAIESLKGSVEGLNLNDRIDAIVASLDGIKGALKTDIATLLGDIKTSIAGLKDYSEILTAIKTAIENIGVVPDERAIDLGLSVKWASMNVGASKPEEFGDYFAWGETKPYYTEGHAQDESCTSWVTGKEAGYDWPSYFDTKDGGTTFETYATDKETALIPEHDAAHVNWGGKWRMPTKEELGELITDCDWKWEEVNGVGGYKLTSKINGNSIFLPRSASRSALSLHLSNTAAYWSSSLSTSKSGEAQQLVFSHFYDEDWGKYVGNIGVIDYKRCQGECIRPVCP